MTERGPFIDDEGRVYYFPTPDRAYQLLPGRTAPRWVAVTGTRESIEVGPYGPLVPLPSLPPVPKEQP